jgi:hypothetical protein
MSDFDNYYIGVVMVGVVASCPVDREFGSNKRTLKLVFVVSWLRTQHKQFSGICVVDTMSFVEVETLERYTGERIIIIYTDSGQKYSDTSNFSYIFHIKQKFFKILSLSQLMSDLKKGYFRSTDMF